MADRFRSRRKTIDIQAKHREEAAKAREKSQQQVAEDKRREQKEMEAQAKVKQEAEKQAQQLAREQEALREEQLKREKEEEKRKAERAAKEKAKREERRRREEGKHKLFDILMVWLKCPTSNLEKPGNKESQFKFHGVVVTLQLVAVVTIHFAQGSKDIHSMNYNVYKVLQK